LQFLVFRLKREPVTMHIIYLILSSVSLCKIPFDERGVIVDRINLQILVPVQIAITATHIRSLKSYLSDDVTTIETGRPTDYSKKLSTQR